MQNDSKIFNEDFKNKQSSEILKLESKMKENITITSATLERELLKKFTIEKELGRLDGNTDREISRAFYKWQIKKCERFKRTPQPSI